MPVEISNRPEKEVIRSNRSRGKEISTRTIDSNNLESTRLTASHVRTPARPAKLHNSGKREKGGGTPRSVLIPLSVHDRVLSRPSVLASFFFIDLFHDYQRNPAKGTGQRKVNAGNLKNARVFEHAARRRTGGVWSSFVQFSHSWPFAPYPPPLLLGPTYAFPSPPRPPDPSPSRHAYIFFLFGTARVGSRSRISVYVIAHAAPVCRRTACPCAVRSWTAARKRSARVQSPYT